MRGYVWCVPFVLLAAACSGEAAAGVPTATPTPTAAALTVHGTLAVQQDFAANIAAENAAEHGPCIVKPGYDDQHVGAKVAVLDDTGKVVGLASLKSDGLVVPEGATKVYEAHCGFTFEVTNVPAGAGFYSVEVAGRDPYRATEAEIASGPVELTLGDIP